MQQTGTRPNTVITGHLIYLLKGARCHRLTYEFSGSSGQFRRRIKRPHAVIQGQKSFAISTRPTPGVQKQAAIGQVPQKPGVDVGHIHIRRICEESIGVVVVVMDGFRHCGSSAQAPQFCEVGPLRESCC